MAKHFKLLNNKNYIEYTKEIFDKANIEYTIMTNQIFDLQEITYLEKTIVHIKKENRRSQDSH